MTTRSKLAVILHADVVGSTALVQRNERVAHEQIQDVFRRFSATISAYGGRTCELRGDALVAEFQLASDAVSAALAFQAENSARQAEDDLRPVLRVGVAMGEVIIADQTVTGTGVVLAQRLEQIAAPGRVVIQGSVFESIPRRIPFEYEDLGQQELKGFDERIRAFGIALAHGAEIPSPEATQIENKVTSVDGRSARVSIAVLPFDNLSNDPEQEYFADGIAEDIITELSRFHWFFVIARNSSFSYKGASPDIRQVGKELGVHYVLEGSVRKGGNHVRITAQLIDSRDGSHVWAERYDRELNDIFAVQDEITQSIVGSISPGIFSAEAHRVARKEVGDLNVWDRVMRAHWHVRRFTRGDYVEAFRFLEEAIEIDPTNAAALGDLAVAHHFSAVFGWSDSPSQSHAKLGEAARKAVVFDDNDAFAHTALAIFELFSNRHDDAARRLQRAIDLNPNLAFARGYLGITHAFSGDYEAAIPALDQALRLSPRDPLTVIWNIGKAWVALAAERYEESTDFARRAVEANPEFADCYGVLAASLGHLGRIDEAQAALKEFVKRIPGATASDERLRRPFKRPDDALRYRDGLCKAGLPS